jgi:hypothetical protein
MTTGVHSTMLLEKGKKRVFKPSSNLIKSSKRKDWKPLILTYQVEFSNGVLSISQLMEGIFK